MRLRISARLFLIVFVMMVLTLGASFVLGSYYEKELLDDIGDQYASVSKALQISVQQMTAQGETDAGLLREYVQRLSKTGVREISILSSEKELVASSNPKARIGAKAGPVKHARPGPLVIKGTLGEAEGSDNTPKIVQDLEIPIVVDDTERGFVRLHLVLDDIQALIHDGRRHRLWATLAVFALGFAGLVALSYGMTRDLDRMSSTLEKVAAGELPAPIASRRQDEIGSLIASINGMLDRLREQRQLSERLERAERLSAIGQLAGAVAHEIRNPLNLISLSVDHLREAYRPAEGKDTETYLAVVGSIREELDRMNGLVGEFLAFGRPPRLAPRACRIEEVVDEVIELTRQHAASRQVQVQRSIPAGLPALWADPDGVRRCLVNLVVNAVQATPAGGRVEVEANAVDGDALEVLVRDTGCGIPPQDLGRIFDPHFSTKPGGFGLGLAITQRIVEESGGRVTAESRPGATTFRIVLPAPAAAPEEASHGPR